MTNFQALLFLLAPSQTWDRGIVGTPRGIVGIPFGWV